jgi:hypothetical protein
MENTIYITHNGEDVKVSIDEWSCTGVTENDGDVFFHFELDDDSVDAKSEIIDEFGQEVYNQLMGMEN